MITRFMNTPFEDAVAVYDREPCARSFDEDLRLHLRHGFVFSTPEFFVMGRPVKSSAPTREIVNPACDWPREECDCWHVYLMAGDMARAWGILPWAMEKFSFERNNRLRVVCARRLQQLTSQIS